MSVSCVKDVTGNIFECDSDINLERSISHDVSELCEYDSKSGSTNVVFTNLL
eukprot:COSAG01_NODE_6461_length_3655_cov_20.982565_6_plen_52_part_00